MAAWVNFAEIRERVSLEDVLLRYYKVEGLKRDGNKLIGPCPVHGGDSPRAFHADLEKNVWHCFSQCQKGGNQLDLVAAKEGISIRDAALRLQEFFLGDVTPPPSSPSTAKPSPPAKVPSTPTTGATTTPARNKTALVAAPAAPDEERVANPPLDLKLDLKSDHPHLLSERGLALETARHFGVGFCSRGILRGCIAIPIHDKDGNLVAYAGRRLKAADIREKGRYVFPRGFKKDLVLYNLNRIRSLIAEQGVLLTEGFFSVLKLRELGFENVVAVMGCSVSEAQAELLAEAKDVTVLFDGNEAGYAGAEAARTLLTPKLPVHVIRLPIDTEPEDLAPKALRWLVNGARALDLAEVNFSLRVPAKQR